MELASAEKHRYIQYFLLKKTAEISQSHLNAILYNFHDTGVVDYEATVHGSNDADIVFHVDDIVGRRKCQADLPCTKLKYHQALFCSFRMWDTGSLESNPDSLVVSHE